MFKLSDRKSSKNVVNKRNLSKIMFLNTVSIICLIDTAFDLVFLSHSYVSGIIWLACLVGISYVYTFFDKCHSIRKLIALLREQYERRNDKSILIVDQQKQVSFYSACISISAFPVAEILSTQNLKTVNILRRVLLFEGAHVAV